MGAEGIKPLASLNAGMLGRGGGSRRVPLTFAPLEPASDDVAVELPEVVQQVARLARALGIDVPADPVVPPVAEAADTGRRRIAFTLRLDAQRHGRLRSIAVAQARSAQQVLVDAFDRYQAGATGHAADLPATAPSHRKAPTGNQP